MTVSRWVRGTREPNIETIQRIASVLGILPSALLDDPVEGAMQDGQAVAAKLDRVMRLGGKGQAVRENGAVPVYRSIRCGDEKDGAGVTGEVVTQIPYDRETVRSGVFGIIAQGDSMWGPPAWIREGFYVLFKPWPPGDIPANRIICATLDGHGDPVCKRIRQEPDGRIVLISDNPDYKPIFLREDQRLVIHGIWFATINQSANGHSVREDQAPYRVKKK